MSHPRALPSAPLRYSFALLASLCVLLPAAPARASRDAELT